MGASLYLRGNTNNLAGFVLLALHRGVEIIGQNIVKRLSGRGSNGLVAIHGHDDGAFQHVPK